MENGERHVGLLPLLKGQRVRLRPLESEDDVKHLFRSFNDHESTGKFVNYEPRSWESFQDFIREGSKGPYQLNFFLIERNSDKKIIGSVAHFIPHPLSKSCLEIGYGIDEPSLREKGYASEGAKLLIDYLFATKTIVRLQATTNISNLASKRVLEKLGFMKEGTLRKSDFIDGTFSDVLIYGLLREEWEKPLKKK